jgi:glycosyltransferase involved in cell wall biosynthesis
MCTSLANAGYCVNLVVADGIGDELKNNIQIHDVGLVKSRFNRIVFSVLKVFSKGLKINGDVYHLHDPELIPIGIILKLFGKHVIFDSHEDIPKQILSKWYLNNRCKKILSKSYALCEVLISKFFDGIITPTNPIYRKFSKHNRKVIEIFNYPILRNANLNGARNSNNELVYVGDITDVRGIVQIIEALEYVYSFVRINLIGQFRDPKLLSSVQKLVGWRKVNYLGYLPLNDAINIIQNSLAGIVLLHPTSAYLEALPVKLFDYMSESIPVLASNFPVLKSIVDTEKCGVCVDPFNTKQIAESINFFVDNPGICQKMGEQGRRAVINKYNWKSQERELISFYSQIVGAD